jgi:hypothetical protein
MTYEDPDFESLKGKRVVDLTRAERAVLAAEAGRRAVAQTKAAGLPVTGKENGQIVRTYPDGRKEILQKI